MPQTSIKRQELFGHPIGLYVLFFTEMWERFSYYGMRGILVLYMVSSRSSADPGLGWSNSDALWLYGWYTMLVYVASIPGGWIADKMLGQKKTVMLGGLLLCFGHGILAIPQDWAFFLGLLLIILGVGGLKPNISTMVGGLYAPGDIRRDSGFTIFYIGINIGAFLAGITVGLVAYYYGWHYGFGLAGIGMVLGQLVFLWGQRHLKGVGEYTGGRHASPEERAAVNRPLTRIEKDRVIVLLLSFLIIIVFWGAFEQAGGLMNLYTDSKIDRHLGFSWLEEVPAAVFQSLNAGYIILFGTLIGGFWIWWKKQGRESSSLFKMAIGTIIMGLGYVFMMFASKEASAETFGKAAMVWIFLAYLFHTIGELCTSPVSLSFITKLAPVKYASIMMGVYFAATGFGNKLAGSIGESSQLKPATVEISAPKSDLLPLMQKDSMEIKDTDGRISQIYDFPINQDRSFSIPVEVYLEGQNIKFKEYDGERDLATILGNFNNERIISALEEYRASSSKPLHANIHFDKDQDAIQKTENKGDGKNYVASFVLEEEQSEQEYSTFKWLTIFTVSFGFLLLLFLKRLKKLTHGAEEIELKKNTDGLVTEGYEVADEEIRD